MLMWKWYSQMQQKVRSKQRKHRNRIRSRIWKNTTRTVQKSNRWNNGQKIMRLVENELGHYKLCEKWEFQKAENETCISQRKSSNQMSTRSHITFPYRQTNVWNITGQTLLSLIIKIKDASKLTHRAHLTLA